MPLPPVSPSHSERAALDLVNAMWPQSARSNATRSLAPAASISFSTNGWQRIAPWPKMIIERVRMLAPSTVIAMGTVSHARPR